MVKRFDWLRRSKLDQKDIELCKSLIPNHYVVLMHTKVIVAGKEGNTSVTTYLEAQILMFLEDLENICDNGGVCQEANVPGGQTCICQPGYSGLTCERKGIGNANYTLQDVPTSSRKKK